MKRMQQTEYSIWSYRIGRDAIRKHQAWVEGGKIGPGRIVLSNDNLAETQLKTVLLNALFSNCSFESSVIVFSIFDECEFTDCSFDRSQMPSLRFRRAKIEDCSFREVRCPELDLRGAEILRCSFQGSHCEGIWFADQTSCVDTVFDRSDLQRMLAIDVDFVRCSFRLVVFGGDVSTSGRAKVTGVTFTTCDFRGANLTGLPITSAVFDHCKLGGIIGVPEIKGTVEIIAPDMSPAGDGTDIVDGAEVLACWKAGKSWELRHTAG
jgi:uncharacterized protein YjbI with pentapeptide repeats